VGLRGPIPWHLGYWVKGEKMAIFHSLTALVCLSLFVSTASQAAVSFKDLETKNLNSDFVMDNEQFRGTWKDSQRWDGTLCDGTYAYVIKLQGKNHAIDFEVKDDSTLGVVADLRDVYFRADGSYRSSYSACLPMNGWTGIGVDRIVVKANAVLGEASLQDIRIKVISTEFGTIHMGSWVPRWFEDFATDLTNRALKRVWSSRLGDWLSAKISTVLKDKMPLQP